MRLGCSTPPTFSMTLPLLVRRRDRRCRRSRPVFALLRLCFRLAGQEGFEPPTRGFGDRCSSRWSYWPILPSVKPHFVSLCSACLRQRGQYLESVSLSCVFFLFFVVV